MKSTPWNRTLRRACLALALAILAPNPSSAQPTYNVIYTFAGGSDGANPIAGLTMDARGNLYGTTYAYYQGTGFGTIYQLLHDASGWRFNRLYAFSGSDGAYPAARVLFGPGAALYGTTSRGGADNRGTVFKLQPSPTFCRSVLCPWIETVLYSFTGGSDGWFPYFGDLAFDNAGNIYGGAYQGGSNGDGVVFELTRSGNSWSESVLHSFTYGNDGSSPNGVTLQAGDLYGTTVYGPSPDGNGTVFQLTPSSSGWAENTLYVFPSGYGPPGPPQSQVTFDGAGNMYGSTSGIDRGFLNPGTVWELMPSGGNWTFSTLYNFPALGCMYPGGPINAPLTMDQAGNLYGTTSGDGANCAGAVFKLSPAGGGQWTYTSLYDFTGGSDGGGPESNVIIDANGNLYGTAVSGGNLAHCYGQGCGVVWKITP